MRQTMVESFSVFRLHAQIWTVSSDVAIGRYEQLWIFRQSTQILLILVVFLWFREALLNMAITVNVADG